MKKILISSGKFLINIGIFFQLIIAIIISILSGSFFYETDFYFEGLEIIIGFITFIILFLMIVMNNFLLYLFISIHDNFESIAESLKTLTKEQNQ